MILRSEEKHLISPMDKQVLLSRLSAVMQKDVHAGKTGQYLVRSLYFDDWDDRALFEKAAGISERSKFRIRCYNHDHRVIHLEKKVKKDGLGYKISESLTREETARILTGDTCWMVESGKTLLMEFHRATKTQGLRPKVLVDYTRTPFVFAPGNVRVTVDENIRTALSCTDFLNPDAVTVSAGSDIILEVKWDEYLPDVIRRAVDLGHLRHSAYSKYAVCRAWE